MPAPAPAERPEDFCEEFGADESLVGVAVEEPGTAEPPDAVETAPDAPVVVTLDDPVVVVGEVVDDASLRNVRPMSITVANFMHLLLPWGSRMRHR